MNGIRQIFFVSIILTVSSLAFAGPSKTGNSYSVKYEGGSVGLKQHRTVKAVVAEDEIRLEQNENHISVPVQSIIEVSCSSNVHRRFVAAVLRRVPLIALDKSEKHYLGVTWTDEPGSRSVRKEVVLRLNAGEYRALIANLERLTAKPVVDTKKTPTVVRYGY